MEAKARGWKGRKCESKRKKRLTTDLRRGSLGEKQQIEETKRLRGVITSYPSPSTPRMLEKNGEACIKKQTVIGTAQVSPYKASQRLVSAPPYEISKNEI